MKDLKQQLSDVMSNSIASAETQRKEYIKEVLDILYEFDDFTVTSWIRHKWPLGKGLFNLG